MSLQIDILRLFNDDNEHDARDILRSLPADHEVRNHKDPLSSIRSCLLRMERRKQVARIEGTLYQTWFKRVI
jgi:hypothetical protein